MRRRSTKNRPQRPRSRDSWGWSLATPFMAADLFAAASIVPRADQASGEHLRLAGQTGHPIPEPLTLQNPQCTPGIPPPFVRRVSAHFDQRLHVPLIFGYLSPGNRFAGSCDARVPALTSDNLARTSTDAI